MKRIALTVGLLLLGACTVNHYDYSTHPDGGGSQPPDTVYIEIEPETAPVPPDLAPDTVISRHPLLGGYVEVEECGNWSKHTLFGCLTETDGVAFEVRPVMISVTSSEGEIAKEYQLEFTCRIQSYMVDSEAESSIINGGAVSATAGRIAMPVVTGTELATLVANRTSFPFLAEQALSYDSDWLPDGTLKYDAVFNSSQWMVRDVCTAEQLVVSSESPEYRMLFGDPQRRLLQQFYDIFVIHDGVAPALPVGGSRAVERSAGRSSRK